MWIVKLGDNSRHSAWDSKKEALQQAKVLKNYGCIKGDLGNFVEYDDTVSCENGHYYV